MGGCGGGGVGEVGWGHRVGWDGVMGWDGRREAAGGLIAGLSLRYQLRWGVCHRTLTRTPVHTGVGCGSASCPLRAAACARPPLGGRGGGRQAGPHAGAGEAEGACACVWGGEEGGSMCDTNPTPPKPPPEPPPEPAPPAPPPHTTTAVLPAALTGLTPHHHHMVT